MGDSIVPGTLLVSLLIILHLILILNLESKKNLQLTDEEMKVPKC